MQPSNQQTNQPFDANYLDTIASPVAVKTINPLFLWGAIGGLLLVVIFIFMAISSGGGSSSTTSLASVGATLSNLQTVSESAQNDIQSGKLRSLNSSLTITLTNANRDMSDILKAQKINIKNAKDSKSVAKVIDTFTSISKRLEDARLNAVYDRTYAREISYAIKTLRSDMAELYKSSKNSVLKTILSKTDESLGLLIGDFETFNES